MVFLLIIICFLLLIFSFITQFVLRVTQHSLCSAYIYVLFTIGKISIFIAVHTLMFHRWLNICSYLCKYSLYYQCNCLDFYRSHKQIWLVKRERSDIIFDKIWLFSKRPNHMFSELSKLPLTYSCLANTVRFISQATHILSFSYKLTCSLKWCYVRLVLVLHN